MIAKPTRDKTVRSKGVDVFLMILLFLFAALIVISRQEYEVGNNAYASLASTVIQTVPLSMASTASEIGTEPAENAEAPPSLMIDFEALSAINNQIAGWIRSDTGVIDYPVVHGEDNDYYLDHLLDGTAQDRIVTLSTCTYDYKDARYVVHCKLVPTQ